jgi:hypothetical protein
VKLRETERSRRRESDRSQQQARSGRPLARGRAARRPRPRCTDRRRSNVATLNTYADEFDKTMHRDDPMQGTESDRRSLSDRAANRPDDQPPRLIPCSDPVGKRVPAEPRVIELKRAAPYDRHVHFGIETDPVFQR